MFISPEKASTGSKDEGGLEAAHVIKKRGMFQVMRGLFKGHVIELEETFQSILQQQRVTPPGP